MDSDGTIQIIGHGTEPARACISQGVVQDLNATQMTLKKALAAAEHEAQITLKSVFCAINGKNVDTFIREGNVKLENQVVETAQMNEALNIASHDILAPGKRVTSSVTAQEWYVDDLRVMDPIGIRGQVLKTRVHFTLDPERHHRQHRHLHQFAGARARRFHFHARWPAPRDASRPKRWNWASACSTWAAASRASPSTATTAILGTQCFEWGGYHLTRDLSAGLHISFEEADELIMSYGVSDELMATDGADDRAARRPSGGNPGTPIKLKTNVPGAPSIVTRNEVEMIIYDRAKELMTKVRQYLQARGLIKNLVCGIVLTGGASEIKNHVELAKSALQVSARKGVPNKVEIAPAAVRTAA